MIYRENLGPGAAGVSGAAQIPVRPDDEQWGQALFGQQVLCPGVSKGTTQLLGSLGGRSLGLSPVSAANLLCDLGPVSLPLWARG